MIRFANKTVLRKRITCLDVVDAYGEVLEREPYGLGGTINVDVLPFDKALIKEALVNVAVAKDTSAEKIAMLKSGFVQLASFQVGGGGKSVFWHTEPDRTPRTREELAIYFGKTDGPQERAIFATVENEMKILTEEWVARVQIAEVVRDA